MAQADPAIPLVGEPEAGRQRPLVTPEGVDLEVRLADAGERAGAFLIDFAIMSAATIALGATIIAGAAVADARTRSLVAVALMLCGFLMRNFYFMAFELSPRAATPGKRLLGLRVAARDGGRLTADAIFARNAMRELEIYLPAGFLFARASDVDAWVVLFGAAWCGVFTLLPLFNRDRLRAGDIVAGTWVLRTPRLALLDDLAAKTGAGGAGLRFSQRELDAYGIKELQVLEAVLRRYEPKTLAAVAERIRAKIGRPPDPAISDGAFLDAYYLALRERLERRMLFGKRRRDKFDTP